MEQNVGENLTIKSIVDDTEFEKWRKFEHGLEVVQIGEGVRQASTEYAVQNYSDPERQQIVVDTLRNEYGEAFRSAIYPKAMDDQMMEILPDDIDVMTYGNVKNNNGFSDELYGLVTNSIDPGDDYVLDLLAARGYDAEPEYQNCIDCLGDDCPICGGNPVRMPGRGFTGPDADKAEEILDRIRKNSIAQAIGRWSRGPDAPRAIIFVRTSVAPDEMVDTTKIYSTDDKRGSMGASDWTGRMSMRLEEEFDISKDRALRITRLVRLLRGEEYEDVFGEYGSERHQKL